MRRFWAKAGVLLLLAGPVAADRSAGPRPADPGRPRTDLVQGGPGVRAKPPPSPRPLPGPGRAASGPAEKAFPPKRSGRQATAAAHGKSGSPAAAATDQRGAVKAAEKPKGGQQENRRKRVVVIDAGHGGKDTGAIGPNGHQEKDIVLAIAHQLHGMLRAERDLQPVMVRRDDHFVSLRTRLAVARAAAADLLVSLHADADTSGQVRGMSVYALSERGAGGAAARWAALRESARAASAILHEMQKFFPIHGQEVQKARFLVLKSPDIPSVLIETGFISHPDGERDLSNTARQKKIARTLFYGIRRFLAGAFRSKNGG